MTAREYDFTTDVAIIGAGPAGAGTSLFLSRAGIRHTIFDAATFPRDKVCGDALSGKVVQTLKKLDPDLVDEMAARPQQFLGSWGVSFVAPNGNRLDVPFRRGDRGHTSAPGYLARRLDFDAFLVEHLNPSTADIRFGTRVKDIEYVPEGVRITFQKNGREGRCLAQLVIGAEGIRSLVAKKFAGHKGDPKHYCSAIRAYYENVADMHPDNFIELYFFRDVLPGYLWVFPLPNGLANVGVGMLSANMKRKKKNLKEMLVEAIESEPLLKDRFKDARLVGEIAGWGLPLGSKRRNLSGERFLLTGDAASLIDPFSGEGIGNALVSAMIASELTAEAVHQRRFSAEFLSAYDRQIYERLWHELSLSHAMQKWGRIQWLFNMVVNKAVKSPTFRETISAMFEDIDLRSRFRSPLFYLKLILNA